MKIIVITGPTGIGKTEISLGVCKDLNKVIINADASQFKKGLNIGTAKISLDERKIVKHDLIDFLDINDNFSIYDYQKKVRPLLEKYEKDNITPFLVGGSGLYIKAALFDYDLNKSVRDLEFDKQYSNFTNDELHQELEKIDYLSSANIHPNNRRRVLRALELAKQGDLSSSKNKKDTLKYDVIFINLTTSRENLYTRINQRFDIMVSKGWIDEVEALKEANVDFSQIKEIGYHEINDFLNDKTSFEECSNLVKQKTRNYAKRQITWIKNQLPCINVEMDYNDPGNTIDEINKIIKNNF